MAHDTIEFIARGALIVRGRVLLCKDARHGYMYLPGGHVEHGESAAAAAAREFKEEAGIEVAVGTCALVNEGAFTQGGKKHHELNIVFHVEHSTLGPEEAVPSLEPDIAFEWVELAAVQDLDVRPEAAKAWLSAGAPSDGVEWVSSI